MPFYSNRWPNLNFASTCFTEYTKANPNTCCKKLLKKFLVEFYNNHPKELTFVIRTELLEMLAECKTEESMELAVCDFDSPYNFAPWRPFVQYLLNEINDLLSIKHRT